MTAIKAILFDLDETLLADDLSFETSAERTSRDLVVHYPDLSLDGLAAAYQRISDEYWLEVGEQVVTGSLDGASVRLESWRRALAQFDCDDVEVAQTAHVSYSRHRLETYALYSDAAPLLASVSTEIRTAIVTNGSVETQWEKIRTVGIDLAVGSVIVSGEVGFAKPEAAIFQLALNRLGVEAHEALHVGDSLRADVDGALHAGLTAVWLNRHGRSRDESHPTPHHEITSLSELPRLLH